MGNMFKARSVPVLGIIALVAVIGFSVAACDDGGGGGGGGGIDSALIGSWYLSYANGYQELAFTFGADGSFSSSYYKQEKVITFTTSGGKIYLHGDDDGETNYSIAGNVLTLSNGQHSLSGLEGDYNKPATGGGGDIKEELKEIITFFYASAEDDAEWGEMINDINTAIPGLNLPKTDPATWSDAVWNRLAEHADELDAFFDDDDKE